MKRFKKILLVCDQQGLHQEAIGRAIKLAKANGAGITLVDVVKGAPGELGRLFDALPGARSQDIELEVREFHRARLEEIAAPIRLEGIETTVRVLQGIAFVEIVRRVIRDGHDLVIKGVGGENRGQPAFLDSIDLHLLRKCPCPVWIVRRSGQRRYARVLAAVDPDPADAPRSALSTLVMDLATSLSAMDGSELHVVNAWTLDEERTLRNSGFGRLSKTDVDLLVELRRKQSERRLNELLRGYSEDDVQCRVHLLKGTAREVIPALAREQRVELIVMGTVGRTGIRGLIIGNTAEAILSQVECSVLAVKPPGFETPVRLSDESAGLRA